MKLDFLSQVTVSAAPVKTPVRDTTKKVRQPESGLTIRLFKDGSVYPSNELISQFSLEYGVRGADKVPTGNGLDVVDSRDMTAQVNSPVAFVGISVSPRSAGKLDLFASCGYDADGTPQAQVATQGSTTYGKKDLIPLLEQVYGDNFAFNAQGYVDLTVIVDQPISAPDDRFFIFKTVSRGANAGKKDYVVRDGVKVYTLIPSTTPEAEANTAEDTKVDSGTNKGKVPAGAIAE